MYELILSTNRQSRRDSTVELSVNAPVGSHDPVYNSMRCWTIEVGDKRRHNDVIVEKVINIDQNSRSQIDTESVSIVSFQMLTESVGSRRELFCELWSHRRRRRDWTRQLCRVGGVYRA